MPYILQEKRAGFYEAGIEAVAACIESTGDLNYVISYLAIAMVKALPKKSYGGMSAIRGAISDAAEEFYRRMMSDYEDVKAQENGDLYDG
jgi:hypothetical protein